MRINKKNRAIAVGTLSVALLAGAAAVSATAAVQNNGSDGPVYVYNGNDGTALDAPGYTYAWAENIIVSADAVNPEVEFACPVGTTGAYTFLTVPGTERGGNDTWTGSQPNSLTGTGGINIANITFINQSDGLQAATIKANGGTYSAGVACTFDNGVNVSAAYYRTATITAGTGAYTLARVDTVTPPVEPPPVGTTGDIALSAGTVGAANGVLGLSVPAGATATFGAPTLVGNKSTTTGTLPEVTVVDGRVVTHEGWTLGATVQEFENTANSADTIAASQLSVAPAIVTAGTDSQGAVAGAAFTGAAASATFASAPAGQGTGSTVLGGALTFVAPQDKAAGTYDSTMTLTVVSQ